MIRRYPPISLEKSDVYTLGNIMYYTLTSDWLWPNIHSTEAAIYQTARGQRSAFPSTIVESQNPAIQALLQAINWCWNHNPEDRPRAVEIQTYLRQQLAKLLGKSTFNLELDDVRVHGIDKLPPNYSYTDSEYNEMFHRERRRLEQKKYTQVEKRQNQDKTTRTSV